MLTPTSKVIATLYELIATETERFQRETLESWAHEDVELPEDRAGLEKLYQDEYRKRAECEVAPGGYRYELSSLDYESLDSQEGWRRASRARSRQCATWKQRRPRKRPPWSTTREDSWHAERYIVTEISRPVGQRPRASPQGGSADRNLQRVADSFTPEEAFRAQGVCDALNHEHEHPGGTQQLIADMERDGLL